MRYLLTAFQNLDREGLHLEKKRGILPNLRGVHLYPPSNPFTVDPSSRLTTVKTNKENCPESEILCSNR